MKPVYEMAVMNVRQLYPDAQDARISSGDMRFRDTLRAILWANYSYMDQNDPADEGLCARMFEDAWETMWKPRFIPDLWSIDSENKIIHLLEIEDTNPLSQEKLMKLYYYWWDMDAIDWKIMLQVFDRYGLNPRKLDLTKYAFHMLPVITKGTK